MKDLILAGVVLWVGYVIVKNVQHDQSLKNLEANLSDLKSKLAGSAQDISKLVIPPQYLGQTTNTPAATNNSLFPAGFTQGFNASRTATGTAPAPTVVTY